MFILNPVQRSIISDVAYVFGGWNGTAYTTDIQQYLPNSIRQSGSIIQSGFRDAGSAVLDNTIYVLGGTNQFGASGALKMTSAGAQSAGSPTTYTAGNCCTTLGSVMFSFGGGGGSFAYVTRIFHTTAPNNGTTASATLAAGVIAPAANTLGSFAYIFGGAESASVIGNRIQRYNGTTRTTMAGSLSCAFAPSTSMNSKIFVFSNIVQSYDGTTAVIESVSGYGGDASYGGATVVNGKSVIFAGSSPINTIRTFDGVTAAVDNITLPSPRTGTTASSFSNQQMMV